MKNKIVLNEFSYLKNTQKVWWDFIFRQSILVCPGKLIIVLQYAPPKDGYHKSGIQPNMWTQLSHRPQGQFHVCQQKGKGSRPHHSLASLFFLSVFLLWDIPLFCSHWLQKLRSKVSCRRIQVLDQATENFCFLKNGQYWLILVISTSASIFQVEISALI